MARFSPDTIASVEQAVDIVSLISEYIPLKRSGKDFKALCPFHNEKTPSFYVSPSKQIYKCFGCGEGGNAFGWVMAMERLSFVEAVRLLAEKAGVQIKEEYSPRETGGVGKERLYKANEWAAGEFEKYLWDDPRGESARKYLAGRGLTEEVARRFRLGFAPAARGTLAGALGKKTSDAMEVLAEAGLVGRGGGGDYYDRFRGRLMFPISDVRARVIAFGGRTLGDEGPKYLNSPETPVFSKGISLYGVHLAKGALLKTREVFVMEGYTDVNAAFQMGVENAVATLGTALTVNHARLLRRWADRVYLVYDADFAGEAASDRGLDILLEEEVEAYVLSLPPGFDPCDYLLKFGGEEFCKLKDTASEVFDFKVSLAAKRHDLSTVAGQSRALDEILETLAKVPSNARRELHAARNDVVRDLSERLKVSERAIRERLSQVRTGRRRAPETAAKAEVKYPGEEAWLVETLLARPELAEAAASRVSPCDLATGELAAILEAIYGLFAEGKPVTTSAVASGVGEAGLGALVIELAHRGEQRGGHEQRLADCIAIIEKRKLRETRAHLRRRLLEKVTEGDREAENELLKEYQKGF